MDKDDSLSQENNHENHNISLNIEFNKKNKEKDKFSKTDFAKNAKNYPDLPSKFLEKNIPWLCSLCFETFSSNKLIYNTIGEQEVHYCKNCHFHLSSKDYDLYLNDINNTTQINQDENSQKMYSKKIDRNGDIQNNSQIETNKQSFYENDFITNIENSNKSLLKSTNSIKSSKEYTSRILNSPDKNNSSTINNLTKANILQTCISIRQNSIKNSKMQELLIRKKRNSLNIRKHIENFTEIKRLHNSSGTSDIINIPSRLSNSPDKIIKTENIESKVSLITLSEAQTSVSQENIPPTLTSTKNYKNKLFSTNFAKSENNVLSIIDCNSFPEKDVFSRHLKISSNQEKQPLFLCDSCKKDLTNTIIHITKEKKYHQECFKCYFCNIPFEGNNYIFYKNNIYHKKCISELEDNFLSKSILKKKNLPETINIESLKDNASTKLLSTKKKPFPKFGGFDTCSGCSDSITFLESYPGPNSTKWHKKCLKCTGGCGKNMDSGALNEVDKNGKMKIYCRACWDNVKRKKRMAIPLVMSNTLRDFSTFENRNI
ncbi:unnamed protein product [Pneumocystis jirovecii]|uniref:LIM zinc-binding domain-containing protein n=1 Tax=Pneumocystis jirovecii TaxID=42068 RepID=L0PAY2_PNEJI|nr:unnamed protein product [Pneumocystis jirovecii]